MFRNLNNHNTPSFDGIETNTYINEVIVFIEDKLALFPKYLKNSSVLQISPNTIEGEDLITENLCSFFTSHEKIYTYKFSKQDNYDFQFINQSKGKGHRVYDAGVILTNTKGSLGKILVIEAKRLPTPGSKREKEYVEGNYGGIERFKKEVHSQEISTNLALMIGYIQDNNSNYWANKVNEWIREQVKKSTNPSIVWGKEDELKKDNSNIRITKFKSTHSRIHLPKISLIHYWIDCK